MQSLRDAQDLVVVPLRLASPVPLPPLTALTHSSGFPSVVLLMPALHQGDARRLVPSPVMVVVLLVCAHEHVDVQIRRPLRSSLESPVVNPAPLP